MAAEAPAATQGGDAVGATVGIGGARKKAVDSFCFDKTVIGRAPLREDRRVAWRGPQEDQWRKWRGAEVAHFISATCDMPQYGRTAERNFTGESLWQLRSSGFLSKGMSRAGICDHDHQQQIGLQIDELNLGGPVAAQAVFALPAPKLGHSQSTGALLPPLQKRLREPFKGRCDVVVRPKKESLTVKCLQRRAASTGMFLSANKSIDRLTPEPYER